MNWLLFRGGETTSIWTSLDIDLFLVVLARGESSRGDYYVLGILNVLNFFEIFEIKVLNMLPH